MKKRKGKERCCYHPSTRCTSFHFVSRSINNYLDNDDDDGQREDDRVRGGREAWHKWRVTRISCVNGCITHVVYSKVGVRRRRRRTGGAFELLEYDESNR